MVHDDILQEPVLLSGAFPVGDQDLLPINYLSLRLRRSVRQEAKVVDK